MTQKAAKVKNFANRFKFSYYYVTEEDYKKISNFKIASGDTEKDLVNQYVRGWISRNRQYYSDLAKHDAKCRGMSYADWAQIVYFKGMKALPEYIQALGSIPTDPLLNIPLYPDVSQKRVINYITLAKENLIFLKVGIYYDGDNPVSYISRIVKEHLQRNWEKLYAPQIAAEDLTRWEF